MTPRLDHILSIGKESNGKRGLGYIDEVSTSFSFSTVFIKVDQHSVSNTCEKEQVSFEKSRKKKTPERCL